MATENGFVKVFRKFTGWKWYDDPSTKAVFLHCLLSANYQETDWHGEVVPAGAFITSAEKLGDEVGLSRQQVRRAFFNLQTTNEITIKSTNKYTIVFVQNWAKYQGDDGNVNQVRNQQKIAKSTNKQPTNNQQTTTDKEYKELQEYEEVKKSTKKELCDPADAPFYRPTLDEVKSYCKERKNKVEPETWFNFYDSKGWLVGKNPMKKWKAAIRTWEANRDADGKKPSIINGKPDVQIGWIGDYMKTIQ